MYDTSHLEQYRKQPRSAKTKQASVHLLLLLPPCSQHDLFIITTSQFRIVFNQVASTVSYRYLYNANVLLRLMFLFCKAMKD